MKTTKKQALNCYDDFHGVLRCHNGGTAAENKRMAPHCYARLSEVAQEAARLAKEPGKRLKSDPWLWEKLTQTIPDRLASFKARYQDELD